MASSVASNNGTFGGPASTTSSLAEAPASDNESVTLLSSGLTTPDTPLQLYRPLREDGESSGSGIGSTPDYENMNASASKLSPLGHCYEQLITTPSPSIDIRGYDNIPIPKPRFQTPRTPYENVHRDFLAAEANAVKMNGNDSKGQNTATTPYENLHREFVISHSEATSASSPPASSSPSLSAGTTAVRHVESSGEDDTLEISQDNFSLDLNAGFDHIYSEIMSGNCKETDDAEVCSMSTDSCEVQDDVSAPSADRMYNSEQVIASVPERQSQNVYQNVPNVSMDESDQPLNSKSDEDVYEEFIFDNSEKSKDNFQPVSAEAHAGQDNNQGTAPLDQNVVYQQVKYLRRSIHEVNALLEDTANAEDAALLLQAQKGKHYNLPEKEASLDIDSSVQEHEDEVRSSVGDSEICPETHFDSSFVEFRSACDDANSELICRANPDDKEAKKSAGAEDRLYSQDQLETCDLIAYSCGEESTQETVACTFPSHPETKDTHDQGPAHACEFPTHFDKQSSLEEPYTSINFSSLTESSQLSEEAQSNQSASGELKGAVDSRRRFESEIGRELVRERRMTQELLEVRAGKTSPNDAPVHKSDFGSKSSVKELLSRFEASPMDSELSASLLLTSPSPLQSRRSDPHPKPSDKIDVTSATLPPCLRARAARIARTKLTPATNNFSASLDEDHFLRSGGSKGEGRALIRTQTEPDVNSENHTGEEPGHHDTSSQSKATENVCAMFTQDDDPQRRERIERYKEERRSFLRKKYRSESFRNEQDDTLARLKQKAGAKAGLSGVSTVDTTEDVSMDLERVSKEENASISESQFSEKLPVKDPGGSSCSKSPSKSKSGKSTLSPTSPEPITCVTVRQRIVTPEKGSLKGCDSPVSPKSPRKDGKKFGFSPEKIPTGKASPERRFPERTRIPVSVEFAHNERRPAQLVLVQRSSLPVASSERRLSAGSKLSSAESNYPM